MGNGIDALDVRCWSIKVETIQHSLSTLILCEANVLYYCVLEMSIKTQVECTTRLINGKGAISGRQDQYLRLQTKVQYRA